MTILYFGSIERAQCVYYLINHLQNYDLKFTNIIHE